MDVLELSNAYTKRRISNIKSRIFKLRRNDKNLHEIQDLQKELDYLEHLLKEADYNDCSIYIDRYFDEDKKPPEYDILDNYIEKEERYFDFRTNSYKTIIKKLAV